MADSLPSVTQAAPSGTLLTLVMVFLLLNGGTTTTDGSTAPTSLDGICTQLTAPVA